MNEADWAQWLSNPALPVKLWEGVVLSLEVDPANIRHIDQESAKRSARWIQAHDRNPHVVLNDDVLVIDDDIDVQAFRKRLLLAERGFGGGSESLVRLCDFAARAIDLRWTIPDEFTVLAQAQEKSVAGGVQQRWPWGSHDTKLLGHLAAAGDKFWKLYDPTDSTTAPFNETVTSWLRERGVPIRVAEIMAQILRADNLPSGPRH
jgi:hypothetical protein